MGRSGFLSGIFTFLLVIFTSSISTIVTAGKQPVTQKIMGTSTLKTSTLKTSTLKRACAICEMLPEYCYCQCNQCQNFLKREMIYAYDSSGKLRQQEAFSNDGFRYEVDPQQSCHCPDPCNDVVNSISINPRPNGKYCDCPGTSWGKIRHTEPCANDIRTFLHDFFEPLNVDQSATQAKSNEVPTSPRRGARKRIHEIINNKPLDQENSGEGGSAKRPCIVSSQGISCTGIPVAVIKPVLQVPSIYSPTPSPENISSQAHRIEGQSFGQLPSSLLGSYGWMEDTQDLSGIIGDYFDSSYAQSNDDVDESNSLFNSFMVFLELEDDTKTAHLATELGSTISAINVENRVQVEAITNDIVLSFARSFYEKINSPVSMNEINELPLNDTKETSFFLFYYLEHDQLNTALLLTRNNNVIVVLTPSHIPRLYVSEIATFSRIFNAFRKYNTTPDQTVCGAYLLHLHDGFESLDMSPLWNKADEELRQDKREEMAVEEGSTAMVSISLPHMPQKEKQYSGTHDVKGRDVLLDTLYRSQLKPVFETSDPGFDIRSIAVAGSQLGIDKPNFLRCKNTENDALIFQLSQILYAHVTDESLDLKEGSYLILSPSRTSGEYAFTALATVNNENVIIGITTMSKKGDFTYPPIHYCEASPLEFQNAIQRLLNNLQSDIFFYKQVLAL